MNNAKYGFTLQKLICDKYNIIPNSKQAINQFNASYDLNIVGDLKHIIDDIFLSLLQPIECTTFDVDDNEKEIPYNFILSDNSTLSIRTNISGSKVAPRIVGQAGYEKLNYYFGNIYGKTISTQDDIKHLICDKIDECLPIFFDHLFDADYILWIFPDGNNFKYHLIKGDLAVNIDFARTKFKFTRNYDEWKESTTLKYYDKSIAEIQVHKERTFKFRFIMNNVIPLLTTKDKNNETLGITAEKTICDMFNLSYPKNLVTRYVLEYQYTLIDILKNAFTILPIPIEYCGSNKGMRGGSSKSSYDFLLYGNKTLSLKTNIGKMVCPPEVGQPNDKTCYLYFKKFTNENHIDKHIFKTMVFNHIDEILPIYIEHLFDSDYLLRINASKNSNDEVAAFDYEIYPKNLGINFVWKKELISFSKKNVEEWNESNTLYYNGVSIGEFQVHSNRNCFKFRFNFNNLIKILRNK